MARVLRVVKWERRDAVKAGDWVVLRVDPLQYGYGRVGGVLSDGRITVRWATGNLRPYHPHELVATAPGEDCEVGAVTDDLLRRLARHDR
jgi:hypothetical protein